MKFSQLVFLAMVVASTDAAECGDLGVMKYDLSDLPDGVNPSSVRRCAGHPASKITSGIATRDGAPASTILGKRDCWNGSPYGCTKGYCWKTCGDDGQWCWTAYEGGWGSWIGCDTFRDCNQGMSCGQGSCSDCGCGC